MKVALLYDAPVSLVRGRLRVHRIYGIYVDALAQYFDHVVICNTVASFDLPEAKYELGSANVSLAALPYYQRIADSPRMLFECTRRIWKVSRSWDLLYMTLPSPLAIIGYLCARARRIPVVLDVEGDLEDQYEAGRYRGVAKLVAWIAVRFFEDVTQWMVNRTVTIAQGEALRRKYERDGTRIVNIPWSPMSEKMILQREDTCQGRQVRLLFVGALLEKKGIFVLLEAARLLHDRMDNFTLTYVGTGPFAKELSQRIQEFGLSSHVILRGGVFEDSELLREFDAADLFMFPSYAEGFPRVIFEAMARGIPVVSTRVSGIPGVVKEGRDALLVNPGSPDEVAEATLKVVRDSVLRRNLIRNGRERVREYTLEETTRRRVEAILSACSPTWT